MPAINYNALPEYLEKTDSKNLPAVLLIHGEEFLYKKALENLLNTLFISQPLKGKRLIPNWDI